MEALSRDTLKTLFKQVVDTLPTAFMESTKEQFDELVQEQGKRTGWRGFLNGTNVFHGNQEVTPRHKIQNQASVKPLAPDLLPAFQAWWQPVCQCRVDMSRVQQSLDSMLPVLADKATYQTLHDMFPDAVTRLLFPGSFLATLDRTKPDLYVGPPTSILEPEAYVAYQEQKRELSKVWDTRLVELYARCGHLINYYLGYRLL